MEMQINNLHVEHLTNGAHFTFHQNTIARAQADEKISTKCAKVLTVYVGDFGVEDEALKLSQKNFLSDDIAQTDALRDDLFLSYRRAVKSMLEFPVAAIAEAAKVLWQHIKDYNINTRAQLDRETGMLKNLTTDLQGKYAEQVETLHLTEVVTQLAEANDRVNTLIEQREGEYAKQKVGAMRAARLKVDESYRKLVQVINALVILEGEADYADFIKLQNQSIARYKREALGETTDGNKKPDESGDEPTPKPEPAITSVYNVEGGDPENPLLFKQDSVVGMDFQGFTLKGQGDTLEHVIGLVDEYDRFTEWIKPEAISNVTETSCQFAMVEDLAGGKFKVRVETYDGGSPLVVEYPELITLD